MGWMMTLYLIGVSWAVGYFVPSLLWWLVVVGWKENTTYRMYLFTSLHFQRKKQIPAIGANLVVIIIIIIITIYPFPLIAMYVGR